MLSQAKGKVTQGQMQPLRPFQQCCHSNSAQLITWCHREPITLDFAEHGEEAGAALSDNQRTAQSWRQPRLQHILTEGSLCARHWAGCWGTIVVMTKTSALPSWSSQSSGCIQMLNQEARKHPRAVLSAGKSWLGDSCQERRASTWQSPA